MSKKILIVCANYYKNISNNLLSSALKAIPKDYNINSPAAYSDPGSYMGMYHGLCGGLMPPILAMTRERSQSDS